MRIKVNDKAVELPDNTSIAELLVAQNVKMPDMVSVELNGDILDRKLFHGTIMKEGDKVEFLYFMGGGRGEAGVVDPALGGANCGRVPRCAGLWIAD